MRTHVDYCTTHKDNYKHFKKAHPSVDISYEKWKNVLYNFNEAFRDYILDTGDKVKFPYGFGDFSITKKKRKKIKVIDGKEYVNLPIDWIKTREKGKTIYNFNYHTEGYFFGWLWFKKTARFKFANLWYFKPSRVSSRLLAHYLKNDAEKQYLYQQWKIY